MRKRLGIVVALFVIVVLPLPVQAGLWGEKTSTEQAVKRDAKKMSKETERASRDAEKKTKTAQREAEKKMKEAHREANKQAKKTGKEMNKGMGEMKKSFGQIRQ